MDPNHVLVLRTCGADMASNHNEFRWPESGPVEAPDWDPEPECGHGLHGLLWGEGEGALLDWSAGAVWLVVQVEAADIVDLRGKVKFPRGTVVHCGDRASATAYLADRGGRDPRTIVGGVATASGYGGVATASGYGGVATANGDRGVATASGYGGVATANGDRGVATASGDRGVATANGDRGVATASSYGGGATANGYKGVATAGINGLASAGPMGIIAIRYWDDDLRHRLVVGYVGEDGIEAGVAYRVEDGKLVRAIDPS